MMSYISNLCIIGAPVEMVQDGYQEVFVKLKGIRELLRHLPDTVNELNEDGRSLVVTVVLVTMTNALHCQKKTLFQIQKYHFDII